MFKTEIEKRVMARITKRLEKAQEEHDKELEIMEARHEEEKEELIDKHVEELFNSIIKK